MVGSFKGWEAEENGKEKRNASVRELESLTNLTCLEIHISDSNLAAQQIRLSPKLVKYDIFIGSHDDYWYAERDDYEKTMNLYLPSEIGAVGKWIQNLVKNTEFLFLEGDGSNNINLEECQVHLRYLRIENCSTLKKVVKTKDSKSGIIFPMLERLSLQQLENLEEIWDGTIILNQNNVSSLSNLKSVQINYCSKLRYLFSMSVATTCLLQIEYLSIYMCSAMEQVFRNDAMTDHGCIEFPKLGRLKLHNLPNLTSLCQGIENIKFPNLKGMWIRELPKLNSFCGPNSETENDDTNSFHLLCNPKVATTCLLQLEVLEIESCEAMEQVFRNDITDGCIEFPKLEKLTLRDLPNMKIILNQNNVSSFCCNLKSVQIIGCSKLRCLLSVSVATTWLSQLEYLSIKKCEAMEQVFWNDITDHGFIEFPKLKKLMLINLPNLTAFCPGIENIKFPNLTKVWIGCLPKLNNFCHLNSETPHDDRNPFHFLCNPKVEIDGLEILRVRGLNNNNIRNIWCHQIPINIFNNIKELGIYDSNGIRSLMSYSIAKNLVSLKVLLIGKCEKMVEVIEGNDDNDKEVVDVKCLFPTLKILRFLKLHKLRRFWQWKHTLELPLLKEVVINNCPMMETFTLGSLNTPNLKSLEINEEETDDMTDLNDILHRHFRTKSQNTSMIEDEDEDKDELEEYEDDEDDDDDDDDEDDYDDSEDEDDDEDD